MCEPDGAVEIEHHQPLGGRMAGHLRRPQSFGEIGLLGGPGRPATPTRAARCGAKLCMYVMLRYRGRAVSCTDQGGEASP